MCLSNNGSKRGTGTDVYERLEDDLQRENRKLNDDFDDKKVENLEVKFCKIFFALN